jgi:hypothetical protein
VLYSPLTVFATPKYPYVVDKFPETAFIDTFEVKTVKVPEIETSPEYVALIL